RQCPRADERKCELPHCWIATRCPPTWFQPRAGEFARVHQRYLLEESTLPVESDPASPESGRGGGVHASAAAYPSLIRRSQSSRSRFSSAARWGKIPARFVVSFGSRPRSNRDRKSVV